MGAYRQWRVKVRQVRDHVQHTYTGNTMTGASHMVAVQMELQAPGQHSGRSAWVMLTPSEALSIAEQLNAQADYADQKNKEN